MHKRVDGSRVKIASTGFYVPDKILTNADLEKMVDTTDEWIVSRSGIKERRIASAEQATSDLCIEAAKRALRHGHFKVEDIDLIIVATASPDTVFPSTACWVQDGLKADHVAAFDISAGCTGFLYGLILSESLILSGAAKRILLIGGEVLSKITNWKDRATCVLFGDAAGAAVLEESKDASGILSHYWKADGSLAGLLNQPAGGTRMPASVQTVAGDLHTIHMKGNEVFKHAVKRMGESAVEALKRAGLKKEDIRWFIPHQANTRIIHATAKKLKLSSDRVVITVDQHGNTSAASVPLALDVAVRDGRIQRGETLLLEAFGGGFTWGSALLKY